MLKDRTRVTAYVSKDEARRLQRLAQRERVTVSTLIRRLIAELLQREREQEHGQAAER